MHTDPRIVRTRKSIIDALLALMVDRKIEKITVKDITMKAGVNRATFYHHFKDKQALLSYTIEERLIRYVLLPFSKAETIGPSIIRHVLEAIVELHDYLEGHCQLNFYNYKLEIEKEIKAVLVHSFLPLVVKSKNTISEPMAKVYTYKLVGGIYSSAVAIRQVNQQRSDLISYAIDELLK